ncbi:hypothetical protein FOZ62_011916, partial [Perkinsus olseni]
MSDRSCHDTNLRASSIPRSLDLKLAGSVSALKQLKAFFSNYRIVKNDFVVVRFQGCASIHPSDLEDIAQQLRHRGNATWVYHARYGVSIIQALVRNIMGMPSRNVCQLSSYVSEAEGQQGNPGPETTELIREICRRFVKDPRLMSQLTADHREVSRGIIVDNGEGVE